MEKQPNSTWMLPLQQIALRRIAVVLYNDPRILASIATLPSGTYGYSIWNLELRSNCRKWRNIIEVKLSNLQLHKLLAKEMKAILDAIGYEIFAWILFHEDYFSNPFSRRFAILQKLCWTTVGTVDYRKTAEELVQSDLVDPVVRFGLACLYCLEDRISILWEDLSVRDQRTFCSSPVVTPDLRLLLRDIRKKHASTYLNFDDFEFDALIPSYPFEDVALHGFKTLAVYCFWNSTKKEREDSLVQTARRVIHRLLHDSRGDKSDFMRRNLSDIACYLLSLMTPDERMEIFKERPFDVLNCFLYWPWQDHFLDTADVIWTFLPESQYSDMILVLRSSTNVSGCYFPSLVQNFFLRSPVAFRKLFVNSGFKDRFFDAVFRNNDTDTVNVIFKSVDAADRLRLVSGESGFQFIRKWRDEWRLLWVYLRAAGLSEKDRERMKEGLRRCPFGGSLSREEFFEILQETDENRCKKQKLGH